ncbi:DUF4430 domain-containing protein [Aminipila butyrica]|uniref:DUF4430 domain-containing protein n=1 Tax=Aminipila butyrica TaxID=433296 RepID=A0A858C050_9FIRM|nr:immunoglobulin-like domain-containing protein [Aminipila butyrica]QIB70424.1 DUF4430 domain-containing protein [Aminipila butyrica]
MFFETNKASKFLALLLTLAMIFTGFSMPGYGTLHAYADDDSEILVSTASAPAEGDGSPGSPYLIRTAEELVWFAETVGTKPGACAVLEDDIELDGNDSNQWKPIGSSSNAYTGTFDGQGHTVSGLCIDTRPESYKDDGKYLGVIGNLGTNGTVKNLSVEGSIYTQASGATYTGGLVGCAGAGSQIVNCANYTDIIATDGGTVGGLVGGTKASAKISGSFNAGSVSGKQQTGGIIGYAQYAEVSYCYNSGDISTAAKFAGGLLGYTYNGITLKNSYNTGRIIGTGNVGSLVGFFTSGKDTVSDCYWLDSSAEKGIGNIEADAVPVTNASKSAAEIQSSDFVDLINGSNPPEDAKFVGVDGEYPVHQWQQSEVPPEMTDEEAVAGAVAALTLNTSEPVTENLTLPLTGINGTFISWSSDTAAVLSDSGVLNPPNKETKVTLTATISKNGVEDTKAFAFTVAAKSGNADAEAVAAAIQSLPMSLLVPENGVDTNLISYVNRLLEKKGITGITVTLTSPGTPGKADVGSIAANGDITYFYQQPSLLGYNTPYVFVDDIKLNFSKGNASQEVTKRARLDWDEGKVKNWLTEAVLDTITWDSIKESNTDSQEVTSSLSLPVRKRDNQNTLLANLTWSSSDTSVIQIAKGELGSDNPLAATVKRQAEDQSVVLTVSAQSPKGGDIIIIATKTINLKVKGDGTSLSEQQKMQAMLDKHYPADCLTLVSTGEKLTDPVHGDVKVPTHSRDWFDEASGLEFATDITDPNSESSTGRNYDFTATVADSQYSVASYPIINVYRPLPGQSVATVQITVTMSKVNDKSISASKTLAFQIAPWEQQELDNAIAEATKLMTQAKADYGAALLQGTKNTADNITESLAPFRKVTLQNEKLIFNSDNTVPTGRYLIADEFPGYDPMKVYSGGVRTFKSSQDKTIAHETLKLVGSVPQDKQVTITAWLTDPQLGRYWGKYGAADSATSENKELYKAFKDFYKNEVNATYTVKGTGGTPDPEKDSATIQLAFAYDGTFEVQPVEMTVKAGEAARFSIGEASKVPTVLDAAVTAHEQKYGEAFTTATANNYMNSGLTKLFGHGNGQNTYFGHYINGEYSDGYANEATLKDGDIVYLYNYGNWDGSATANFYKDGSFTAEEVTEDGTLTLSLLKAPGHEQKDTPPAAGVPVGVMDKDGKLSGDKIVSTVQTKDDGSFTLHFTEDGTFFILSGDTCEGKTLYPAWCKVIVSGAMTEEEKQAAVSQDKTDLVVDGLNPDGTLLGGELTLVTRGTSGKTVISWRSDTPSVITADGQIIRDSQAHMVKLTADISCGGVSESKEFTVQVPALTDDEAVESLNKAKSKLTSEALVPMEYDGFDSQYKQGYYTDSKELDTSLLTKAIAVVKNPEIRISIDSSANSAINADGKITYGSSAVTEDVVFGLSIGGQTQQHTVRVTVPTHLKNKQEYMAETMNQVEFEQIKGENLTDGDVRLPLLLPNELDVDEDLYSMAEISATWSSDHPDIVKVPSYTISSSETNYNAVYKTEIIRPQTKTTVKLTGTFGYNTEYDSFMGTLPPGVMPEGNMTKVITVVVNPLTDEEKEAIKNTLNAALSSIGSEKITAYHNGKDSGVAADLTAVMDDLHLYDFDKKSGYGDSGIKVTWSTDNPAITVNTLRAKVSRPIGAEDAVGKLTVTLFKDNMSVSKSFDVTVLADSDAAAGLKAEALALTKAITSQYAAKDAAWWGKADSGTFWHVLGMEAYKDYQPDTENMLSKEAKQAFVNKMIAYSVEGDTDSIRNANTQANVINGLSALGYDATNLWTVNHSKISAVEKLKAISINDVQNKNYRTIAPYVLTAFRQGNYNTAQQEAEHIKYLLEELKQDSNWTIVVDYPAMMMQGLTPYYNQADVKAVLDTAVTKLSALQGENGSFGNANSDAMVMITLAQLGINPASDSRFIKGDNSLLDGLLLYKTDDNKGFGYKDKNTLNEMSTYQGLLGLISTLNVMDSGKDYSVYDFSKGVKTAAYANGTIVGDDDVPAGPEEGKDITVSFTMKGDKGTWIPTTSVTLKEDSKVYHAFVKVLDDAGFTYVGANKNYVSSITHKNGTTLAEFTNGPDSGWLYKVNGTLPNVGLKAYTLSNGDKIVWYYTNDWTKDPGAIEAMGGSSAKPITEEKTSTAVGKVEAEAKTNANGVANATIADKDISSAIKDLLNKVAESKKDLLKSIAIEVKADTKAVKVETVIAKSAVTELGKKVDEVQVNTPLANISLDSKTLKQIAGNLKGDIKVAAEKTNAQKFMTSNEKLSQEKKNSIEERIGSRPVFDFTMQSGNESLTQFDGKITISMPYKLQANEKPEGVAAYYISSDGTMTKMADSKYKNERVEFTTDHFSYYAVGYEETMTFTDVSADAWYAEAVSYAVKNNLMKGVSTTAFKPSDKTTRAMLTTILYNAEGKPEMKAESPFADVDGQAWYGAPVIWASQQKIVKGMSTNAFMPETNLTREQVAVMLYNYASFKKMNVEGNPGAAEKMTDSGEISSWAKDGVAWALNKNIIKGKGSNILDPKGQATRAEIAQMIKNFMENK